MAADTQPKATIVMLRDEGEHLRGEIVEVDTATATRLINAGAARPYDPEARTKHGDKWSPRLTTR